NWAEWYTGVDIWGLGVAQGIDSAAMILYLSYRHVQGDLLLRQIGATGTVEGPIANAPLENLDLVISGVMIKF
ncbi:MAG TPA: hypothetical protein VFF87_11755, partial [Hyphomicrobium sp.]|nr:hypothetical protein [Hyphomicrobium sp.]